MARNNISLSCDELPGGRFKVRWREDVVVDGERVTKARSRTVTDKGARDELVAKLRRTLETGAVFEPEARKVTTAANLELAALAWLRWQASRDRKAGTREKYKAAIARIMGTIRKVEGIRADEVIPVSVLDVELFSDIRNQWIAEDAKAGAAKTKRGACSPMRRYHLSGFLFAVWSFAASQPAAYPLVPALVDRGLVIPPVPAQPGAPEAPTWAECDAVVRRAYDVSDDYGDALAGERLTGLRIEQVVTIRRRALDPVRSTLTVEVGKSAAEQAEMRTVPVPRSLVDVWQRRIAAAKGPDAYLFPAGTECGHVRLDTLTLNRLWKEAEEAGEVRANLVHPLTRRKGRPNHAFRAAYMAGLQGLTVEVDGAEVQRVSDRTIDYLVGHRPLDTRARHYTPPSAAALAAAVGLIPPIDLKVKPAGNVVPITKTRG